MPKEPRGDGQGCVGERERIPRPASKNAKDKSNSAALLASRVRVHTAQENNGRGSRCSEKDSGYSDTGSDSLQIDADDQQGSGNDPQVGKGLGGAEQGRHIQVPGTPELTPIFILKNVVLKQPGQSGLDHTLPSSLSWGGSCTGSQGPTHILLLQQPGINPSVPLHVLKPQPQRTEIKSGKTKNTYLPILNSYPRIAPHPSKKTPDKTLTSRESATDDHSLSKRLCTEDKTEEVSTTTQAPKHHKHQESNVLLRSHSLLQSRSTLPDSHQHQSLCRTSSPPTTLSVSSPSVSSTQTPSPPSSDDPTGPVIQSRKDSDKNCQGSAGHSGRESKTLNGTGRHRRFRNTVEILSQSGLLDITLRTQDLLRQNAATDRDIAQLRQHAQLLCQAAQAGADAPAIWEKLHQVMADSGHYPSLKCLGTDNSDGGDWSQSKVEVEAATSTKPDTPVVYKYGLNGTEEVAPPSPLLAPIPDAEYQAIDDIMVSPEQCWIHRKTAGSPEDSIMPPDSSTHENLN